MQPKIQKGILKKVVREKGSISVKIENTIVIPEKHFKLKWKILHERRKILNAEIEKVREIAKIAKIDLEEI